MKISQVIKYFEEYQKKNGDVDLITIYDDGRCSETWPYEPSIKYTTHWNKTKGHFVS